MLDIVQQFTKNKTNQSYFDLLTSILILLTIRTKKKFNKKSRVGSTTKQKQNPKCLFLYVVL